MRKTHGLGVKTVFLTQVESFESTYETIELVGRVLNAGIVPGNYK